MCVFQAASTIAWCDRTAYAALSPGEPNTSTATISTASALFVHFLAVSRFIPSKCSAPILPHSQKRAWSLQSISMPNGQKSAPAIMQQIHLNSIVTWNSSSGKHPQETAQRKTLQLSYSSALRFFSSLCLCVSVANLLLSILSQHADHPPLNLHVIRCNHDRRHV
jgi:hypothetical protein